MTHWNSVARS